MVYVTRLQNQWESDQFYETVSMASRFEMARQIAAGAEPASIKADVIRQGVVKQWLATAIPAGNA